MPFPVSTYRLQFRGGMDFDRAIGLVPYLKRLGITHLYASPVFAATTGSTHGYDVTDANVIDPLLGGREGLERLVGALKSAALGLILDIVPNHMAASLENPWWYSVVEWGEASRYGHYFDVDWGQRLTLPFLGKPFEEAVADGEITLTLDRDHGTLAIGYFDSLYPLKPSSYPFVLKGCDSALAARLADLAGDAEAGAEDAFHDAVRALSVEDGCDRLIAVLNERSQDARFLMSVHDLQPYRLMHWSEAAKGLSYRRFFEIAGLVGLRVEVEDVFDDAHRTVLDLVRSGHVDGLRIDHVDGLADPAGYLQRLRRSVGDDVYIIVEKILAPGEQLPTDWPVQGTTGYEFIAAQVPAFLDTNGFLTLRQAYGELAGEALSIPDRMREAKLRMIRVNFAGEVKALVEQGSELLGLEAETMRGGLEELLLAFPRYRTYGAQGQMCLEDRALLDRVLTAAKTRLDATAADVAWSITDLLKGAGRSENDRVADDIFRRRFQQLTGPLMAKSLEDTLFFRHVEFLALNEVGGELEPGEGGIGRFHAAMEERLAIQPFGLSASSTHDTKRGEDARARLFALAEDAGRFVSLFERWREMNNRAVQVLDDGPAPDPELEWMIFQALVAHWPAELDAGDREGVADFTERLLAFLEKSVREAKLRSDWNGVNDVFETAVKDYVRTLMFDNHAFVRDVSDEIRPIIRGGLINSLSFTAIKLTAPGIPDIYQGSEGIDLSFVDPDNRRPPAFAALSEVDPEAPMSWNDRKALEAGWLKQALVGRILALRNSRPDLFARGDYIPLRCAGSRQQHVIAFARRHGDQLAVTIACRWPMAMLRDGEGLEADQFWGDTRLVLPDAFRDRTWSEVLSGRPVAGREAVLIRDLMDGQTVAILTSDD